MQQRDIIKDQIEQLGKVLGKLITLMLGLKGNGDILDNIQQVAEEFDTELHIDLNKLIALEQEEFQKALAEKFQNFEAPLEQLGDLLSEIGQRCGPEGALRQQYLQKALWTYEYINTISATFSMERMGKMSHIKKLLIEPH